jgi:hypothetical protein
MENATLVLIPHFAAKIKIITFLNWAVKDHLWDMIVTSPQM